MSGTRQVGDSGPKRRHNENKVGQGGVWQPPVLECCGAGQSGEAASCEEGHGYRKDRVKAWLRKSVGGDGGRVLFGG